MATDLHTRLVAAITARLNLAEAALAERESDWWWGPDAESACERHIAANDPAFVAGACRADLELVKLHAPPDQLDFLAVHWIKCRATFCGEVWPCTFVRNRAGVYGVNLDEQEG